MNMSFLLRLIRFLFLVKEIVSKEGVVHFRRYRLISTRWFNLYVHQICESDHDRDPHDHPWNFQSLILSGGYFEEVFPKLYNREYYYEGDVVQHKATDAHKLTLLTDEVWTLVLTTGRERYWGYQTSKGWVGHEEYRKLKNESKL